MDTMGFKLWGFGGALPVQEMHCRSYLLQWEGAVIYISWRQWSGHSVRRRSRKKCFLFPLTADCTQAWTGIWYIWQVMPGYFINGAALEQGEIQSEKTKQEQQNNLLKKMLWLLILCRSIHISHHHLIWCPIKPTVPWYWIVHTALATL